MTVGQTCPSCGEELPAELGQHARNLLTGTVDCPHCGASVDLRSGPGEQPGAAEGAETADAAPPGRPEGEASFSGQETIEGLADELDDKPT